MKYSIIIVSYNAGEKLKQTVESCLLQTYEEYEIIVKDACSVDDSTAFIDSLQEKRIKLFNEKDTGIYDGMNQAIDYAEGDFCIFMNCGDSFYNRKVLETVSTQIIANKNNVIYFGNCYVISRHGVVTLPEQWDDYCCYRYTICHQAMFYPIEYLRKHKFDTHHTISACITHYIEAYAKYGMKLIHIPLIVCNYEGGGVSDSSEGRKKSLSAQYRTLKECFGNEHKKYMIRIILSGQLIKQRISTVPWLHGIYEKIASAVYSRRTIN